MLHELHVDDLINSTSDTTKALQFSEEIIHILGEAGMNLRRWATNSTTLHEAWKCANIDCRKPSEKSGVQLKILGIIWDNRNDNLNFDIRQFEKLKIFMKADICHSYQILKNHGIPDERIIVLMTDDQWRNRCPESEDVTPKNSMAVLKGDEKTLACVGSGKVRKSGPSDHVFGYFADHGAPGLIAFPQDELSAMDLNRTINKHVKRRFLDNWDRINARPTRDEIVNGVFVANDLVRAEFPTRHEKAEGVLHTRAGRSFKFTFQQNVPIEYFK
ncbi:legumain [Trichonephila clavipes]|nr:legumain [Trichonephila clavipes]